jgi:hypothetical protein
LDLARPRATIDFIDRRRRHVHHEDVRTRSRSLRKPDPSAAKAMLRAIANLDDDELAFLKRRLDAAERDRAKERRREYDY